MGLGGGKPQTGFAREDVWMGYSDPSLLGSGGYLPANIRGLESYQENAEFLRSASDNWEIIDDKPFVDRLLNKRAISRPPLRDSPSPRLCKRCSSINLSQPISLSELRKSFQPCDLCDVLSQSLRNINDVDATDTTETPLSSRRLFVRICAPPGSEDAHPDIPIGVPMLPEPESPIRFDLIREWLRDCDESHKDFQCTRAGGDDDYDDYGRPSGHMGDYDRPDHGLDEYAGSDDDYASSGGDSASPSATLPTRLLDVGDGEDAGAPLRVWVPRPGDRGDYVALSHCWGNLTEDQKKLFCTSVDNIAARRTGFDMSILPRTFRDAITVTRKIGKRYLWIDSLCIIQYGDNLEDWKKEAGKMESVFRNAYCTIAATAAQDSTKGFLTRSPAQQRAACVRVNTASHGPVYFSTVVDDFHRDVEMGPLNQRAWVFQERALSRRTINFTATQAYWECGYGVRCETLTCMRNSRGMFLGDPKFPWSLRQRDPGERPLLVQFLFTTYCKLGITRATDRPVAISGLENRLAIHFETESSYGVLHEFLHRCLLWCPLGTTKMDPISHGSEGPPSWSWMAYSGQIEYIDIPYNTVEWNADVKIADGALRASVGRFRGCKIEEKDDGSCVVQDEMGHGEVGRLKYNQRSCLQVQTLRCVVVGRDCGTRAGERRCYILVVLPVSPAGCASFRRVAAGYLSEAYVSTEGGEAGAYLL